MRLNKIISRTLAATLTVLGYGACTTEQPDLYGPPVLYGPPQPIDSLMPDSTADDPTNVPDLYGPKMAPYNPHITDDVK